MGFLRVLSAIRGNRLQLLSHFDGELLLDISQSHFILEMIKLDMLAATQQLGQSNCRSQPNLESRLQSI